MDFIRGISAVLVCCGHLRAVMFIDFNALQAPTLIDRVFYFLSSLGHEAVMVFFVLSGFFVGGSVLSKRFRFGFDSYLIARLSRLWTVLFPALVFTFLIDLVTGYFYPEILSGDYHAQLVSGPGTEYSSSVLTFISNLAFIQTIYAPVFGTNGPLWSLTNEFWYYITFPLLMIAFGTVKQKKIGRIVAIVGMLIVIYFFTIHLMDGFIIWLLGVLVFLVYSRNKMNYGNWFLISTFGLFIASLVNSKVDLLNEYLPLDTDYVVGLCFSLFLISLRTAENTKWVKKYLSKIAFWLSDISYTLYVIHFPILMIVYGGFYRDDQVQLEASSAFQFIGWLFLLMFISRGFWYVFEKNTHVVRNLMFKFKNYITNQGNIKRSA